MKTNLSKLTGLVLSLSAFASQAAYSAPQQLGQVVNRPFTLFGERALNCSMADNDNDGQPDTAVVWSSLGAAISTSRAPGLLQNPYIEQQFPDANGEICARVKRIQESSAFNYGALFGTSSSTLTLDGDKLVEDVTITINSSRSSHAIRESITLTTRVEKELQ